MRGTARPVSQGLWGRVLELLGLEGVRSGLSHSHMGGAGDLGQLSAHALPSRKTPRLTQPKNSKSLNCMRRHDHRTLSVKEGIKVKILRPRDEDTEGKGTTRVMLKWSRTGSLDPNTSSAAWLSW